MDHEVTSENRFFVSKDSENSNASVESESVGGGRYGKSANVGTKRYSPESDLSNLTYTKRKTIKTTRFDNDFLENGEKKLIQQALRVSQIETKREVVEVPFAPTFTPTLEDFSDPIAYINKIAPEASKYGICKVIPPKGWKCPCEVVDLDSFLFPTNLQQINTLQEGNAYNVGKKYTVKQYREMADEFLSRWLQAKAQRVKTDTEAPKISPKESFLPCEQYLIDNVETIEQLIKDYWDIVETGQPSVAVEYGNDLDTLKYKSGFPVCNGNDVNTMFAGDYYRNCGWNLNNLPFLKGSLLRHLKANVNGVNVPWLYCGMLFSTFCWHMEDNYLNSVNYNHYGDVKVWYGIPGEYSAQFDKVAKTFLLEAFQKAPDLLQHITMQISPSLFIKNGVPVYKCYHQPGTFMFSFPKAYHAGFSVGFNIGEAVNFATADWLQYGAEAEEKYRLVARASVFSHDRLLFVLANHLEDIPVNRRLQLATDMLRVVNENIVMREAIYAAGVRDISKICQLPRNNFQYIDKTSADYDDIRVCNICNHFCIFTAVGCECNQTRVACIRHYHVLCKCPNDMKFCMTWASDTELKHVRDQATQLIASL